jgi:hypothetical protein
MKVFMRDWVEREYELPKGNGRPTKPEKTRWIMRNGDGSEFTTDGVYTSEEVEKWECSRPVKPLGE